MICTPTDIKIGAPADAADREPRERRCYEFLDRLGVSYRRADHEAANTMELCREIEKSLGCPICKNLLLTNRQQTDFYLLLMEGDKVFKTKYLSKALGCSRLSFATDEHMEQLVDITPGSLSVLGLMNDPEKKVRLVIDRPVLEQPEIGQEHKLLSECESNISQSTVFLKASLRRKHIAL